MFSKSLDVIKILLVIFVMVTGYTVIKNITEPMVCLLTNCKAELEQTVKNQKQKIQDLEKTIEEMKKNHEVELINLNINKEVIQEVQDKNNKVDEKKVDVLNKINLTSVKSKTTKNQAVKSNQNESAKVPELVITNSDVSLSDTQKAEIQIDAIWELYCSSNYVTCKG